ncbi:primosomal protein N' [Candidatus Parcubacteria bacterium]|nr:primosomal protein N' [Candidatus Parcubacteria bacterium]
MHIVEVIPLTTLPQNIPQILSYYFDSELLKGSVVEINLNNRTVSAVVVSSTSLEHEKAFVKKSLFQMKKINKVISATPAVSEFQFKIALWIAKRYYSPLGITLNTVLPPFFLKKKYPVVPTALVERQTSVRPRLIVARTNNIIPTLQEYLKEGLYQKGQILVLTPELATTDHFYTSLSSHAPTALVNSGISNKDYYRIWQGVSDQSLSIIVGTRQALFLPFADLRLIVVDDALHEFYKSDSAPKYSAPALAQYVASLYGAQIVYTSPFQSAQHTLEEKNKTLSISQIAHSRPQIEVIDLASEARRGYGMISQPARQRISQTLNNNKRVLIFSARRGFSGVLLCDNCGVTVQCPQCNTPMHIHKAVDLILMCHRCNATQIPPKSCLNCKSYNLRASGTPGSQKLFEELQRIMTMYQEIPQVPVLILDSDVTQNETEEEDVIQELIKNPKSILIATQKIFSYRYRIDFGHIAIPSFDALTYSPDYQSQERLWYQMEKLLDFNPASISLQTFDIKQPFHCKTGNYEEFYDEELQVRSLLGYPPFSTLAKLTYTHSQPRRVAQAGRLLVEKLKMVLVQLGLANMVKIHDNALALMSKEKGVYSYSIILKMMPSLTNPRDVLKFIPAGWHIDIDPREII